MLILISEAILSDPAKWLDLESLLDLARRNRCYVDALDPATVLVNPWLEQADRHRRQNWFDATAWATKDAALFRLRTFVADVKADPAAGPPRITIGDAVELVSRPAMLWLENGRNDRRFLLAMMPEDRRTMLLEWEAQRVISFENGGGLGELRKLLEEQEERGLLDKRKDRALFDSDADAPGNPSKAAALMSSFCKSRGIEFHCLARRSIENYLPRTALWSWAHAVAKRNGQAERRARVEAYWRMSDVQRRHYHLKNGWDADPSAQAASLYADVSEDDRRALQNGIDRNIAALYEDRMEAMHGWASSEEFDAALQAAIDDMTDWMRVPYAR